LQTTAKQADEFISNDTATPERKRLHLSGAVWMVRLVSSTLGLGVPGWLPFGKRKQLLSTEKLQHYAIQKHPRMGVLFMQSFLKG
jgi:hypothetical protein